MKMSYQIEQLGYEYRGYKLGQMTDRGMIIGFDLDSDEEQFIAVLSDDEDCVADIIISDSCLVGILLDRHENSKFNWHYRYELEIIKETTVQFNSNPLQLIRKAINGHTVKLELFAEEFCVSLYDSEIPICWNKDDGVYILTEVMNSNIYSDMISEIAEVMKIIEGNLEWFKGCMNG